MSIEEQDAAIGRLLREYQEAGREMEAVVSVVRRAGDSLFALGKHLMDNTASGMLASEETAGYFAAVPDLEEVRASVERARELVRRRKEIFASLSRSGMPPREDPIPGTRN